MRFRKAIIFLLVVLAFMLGWFFNSFIKRPLSVSTLPSLRLEGYEFTKPLLLCNAGPDIVTPKGYKQLEETFASIVRQAKEERRVEEASIYFRNLESGAGVLINPDNEFFPASLVKIPLMIAYFKLQETYPGILKQKVKYDGGDDLNVQQEFKPASSISPGKAYTVFELIEYMILYSDNNAAAILGKLMDQEYLHKVYTDLHVPFFVSSSSTSSFDYMSIFSFSSFFRVLYNSTYLSQRSSEDALALLTKSVYSDGLLKGVPSSVRVAHKFGLSLEENALHVVSRRQLHDCGIVFLPSHPYLLCVMTKTGADALLGERLIADVSRSAYSFESQMK